MSAVTEPIGTEKYDLNAAISARSAGARRIEIAQLVFAIFFLQLILIVLLSLVTQSLPIFIPHLPFFGWDYHSFHVSADYWLRGINPYTNPRFNNPPSSLLPALVLHPFGFATARYLFFAFNVFAVLWSMTTFSRTLGLPRRTVSQLAAITLMYYPFYAVIERGNMDGVMLACVLCAYQARHRLVRAALLAFSVGIKLYTGLLVVVFARKRRFDVVAAVIAILAILQLPFFKIGPDCLSSLLRRADMMWLKWNISPAALFWYSGMPWWKVVYLCFWAGSLAFVLARDGHPDDQPSIIAYIPWMISIPTLVLNHSGVMFLPLLALLAKQTQTRPPFRSEWLLLGGLLLTGIQASAFANLFSSSPLLWDLFFLAAPIGSTLILLSVCAGSLSFAGAVNSAEGRGGLIREELSRWLLGTQS